MCAFDTVFSVESCGGRGVVEREMEVRESKGEWKEREAK